MKRNVIILSLINILFIIALFILDIKHISLYISILLLLIIFLIVTLKKDDSKFIYILFIIVIFNVPLIIYVKNILLLLIYFLLLFLNIKNSIIYYNKISINFKNIKIPKNKEYLIIKNNGILIKNSDSYLLEIENNDGKIKKSQIFFKDIKDIIIEEKPYNIKINRIIIR